MATPGKQLSIQAIFEAVDRFTAPLKKIKSSIEQTIKPLTSFDKSFGNLSNKAGLNRLVANFSNFKGTIGDATKHLGGFESAIASLGGVGSATGMAMLLNHIANSGFEAKNAADMLGVTTQQLQGFGYAATAAGLSSEEFDHDMIHLQKSVAEASTGTGEFAMLFNAIGINARTATGRIKPITELLPEIADKIAQMPDPANQARVAMEIFGRSGVALLPFLKKGSAGIGELKRKAEELGIVMSENTIKNSEAWTTSLRELGGAMTGISYVIADTLLPVFTPMIDKTTKFMENHKKLIADIVMGGSAIAIAVGGFAALGTIISLVGSGLAVFGLTLNPIGFLLAGAAYLIYDNWEDMPDFFKNIWDSVTKTSKDAMNSIQEMLDTAHNWIDDLEQSGINTYNKVVKKVGLGSLATTPSDDGSKATTANIEDTRKESDVIKEFMKLGWSKEQATGITANLVAESKLDKGAVGDNGNAYGLAQWHKDRQKNFLKLYGHTMQEGTFGEQIGFVDRELRHGTEQKAGQDLMKTTTAHEAAKVFAIEDERPAFKYVQGEYRARLADHIDSLPENQQIAANNNPEWDDNYKDKKYSIGKNTNTGLAYKTTDNQTQTNEQDWNKYIDGQQTEHFFHFTFDNAPTGLRISNTNQNSNVQVNLGTRKVNGV